MMVLMRGARGLFCSDGIRIYFPDRSWRGAVECFIEDYEIKNDKGNYAFIVGTPIVTEPITAEEIPNLEIGKVYKQINLGNSTAIAYHKYSEIYFLVKSNGKISKHVFDAKDKDIVELFKNGTAMNIDAKSYIEKNYRLDTNEKVLEGIFRGVKRITSDRLAGVEIVDDTYILLSRNYEYTDDISTTTYYYNCDTKELVYCELESDKLRKSAKKIKKYSISDIAKEMIKYGVTVNNFAHDVQFSDRLRRCNISKDSFNAVIYAFDADKFTFDYYNSDACKLERQIVEQSINMYNDLVKLFGKRLDSKKAVEFLSRVNLRNYLLKSTN